MSQTRRYCKEEGQGVKVVFCKYFVLGWMVFFTGVMKHSLLIDVLTLGNESKKLLSICKV